MRSSNFVKTDARDLGRLRLRFAGLVIFCRLARIPDGVDQAGLTDVDFSNRHRLGHQYFGTRGL